MCSRDNTHGVPDIGNCELLYIYYMIILFDSTINTTTVVARNTTFFVSFTLK